MRIKIPFLFFLLICFSGFSQSKLCVLLKSTENETSLDSHCPIKTRDYELDSIAYVKSRHGIYTNWTAGINLITKSLERDKYRVKLQDSKCCFAKL